MHNFYLKPKLFSVLKTYSRQQLANDIIAGIIVAIIALPLSIALALASGVEPACGVYTAIAAGFSRCSCIASPSSQDEALSRYSASGEVPLGIGGRKGTWHP